MTSCAHLRLLERALQGCRRAFAAVAVLSFGVNLLMLALPLYTMQMFDRVITTRNMDTLAMLTLMLVVSLAVMAGFDLIRSFVLTRLGGWFERELAGPVLAATFDRAVVTGGASAQGLRDLASLRGFIGGPSILPLFDAPWAPLFLAVVFLVHPALGLVSLAGMAVLGGLALLNERLTRAPLEEAGRSALARQAEIDAAVRNADVVAALGMGPALIRRYDQGGQAAGIRVAADRAALVTASVKFARLLLQGALLGVGAWLAVSGKISGGAMIAASIIMGRAVAPVEQAVMTWRAVNAALADYRRLRALLEEGAAAAPSSTALPAPAGRLDVEGVGFVPPGASAPTLQNIAFALEPGESLGIIGPSGAGKTTLVRMVVGSLRPTIGAIRLDGADVSMWAPADRGRHMGYLPQDVELFDATVRANIARLGEATDEAVVEAARLAGAHDLILSLPQGYDTVIGAGGVPLSGGQRQRIGLARAVFGRPRLVVLDEPNANLDAGGERALLEALDRLRRGGTTVVMIAQRLGVLTAMDKILVLAGGRVERFGRRAEVLGEPPPAPTPNSVPTAPAAPKVLTRLGKPVVRKVPS